MPSMRADHRHVADGARRRRDRRRGRVRGADRDRGAGLILAIGFVTLVGAITAGLSGLVMSGLNDRVILDHLRDRQYAADAAVEDAIAAVRGLSRSASCSSTGGVRVSSLNHVAVRVDWRARCGVLRGSDGAVVAQRNVVFTSCEDTGVGCAAGQVILSAQVNFEETGSGAVSRTFVQSWSVTP